MTNRPDFDAWQGDLSSGAIDASTRAVLAWGRIGRLPVTITIKRGGTTLDGQVVRVVAQRSVIAEGDGGTTASRRRVVVFGVKDHPDASVLDTDIARGDSFSYEGSIYRIDNVVTLPGEIQASGVAQQ